MAFKMKYGKSGFPFQSELVQGVKDVEKSKLLNPEEVRKEASENVAMNAALDKSAYNAF